MNAMQYDGRNAQAIARLHVANQNQPLTGGLIMTDPDIQKSKHFLKSLNEDMVFMSSLVSQINNLSSKFILVSSKLKSTWGEPDRIHKNWEKRKKEGELS